MRIVIAGSRTVTEEEVRTALNQCDWIGFVTAIVSGTAKGADQFGERWAEERGIEIHRYPAEWKKFGKRAGPIRNKLMAENAEGLIAVWDGKSRGTFSMIEFATQLGLRVGVYRTDIMVFEEVLKPGALADVWMHAEERAAIMEYSGGLSRLEAEQAAGKEARGVCNDKN